VASQADIQCVPGVSADPQQQIRALEQQLSDTLQQIDGLRQLVLEGNAAVGGLLTATARAAAVTSSESPRGRSSLRCPTPGR
jgi:hypothetical protein